MSDETNQVTIVLDAIAEGDLEAGEKLLPLVYDELRKLARARMAHIPPGQTLQPTALVHEAYMRLRGSEDPGWKGRGHFFGAAAQAMRDILIEQARRKSALNRGGDRKRADLRDAEPAIQAPGSDILALEEPLRELEAVDRRKSQIVNLRFFVGLTVAETANTLGLSVGTVEREWRYIKAWLATQLNEPLSDSPDCPAG